jgi:hypothetical protein
MTDERDTIEIKEKLGFDDIFAEGRVKQIKWGREFLDWPIQKREDYAKKLASAMNQAADEMQQDRDRHLEARVVAEKQREEAEQARDIAKDTLMQNIMESNAKEQELLKKLIELQARVTAQDKVIEELNGG